MNEGDAAAREEVTEAEALRRAEAWLRRLLEEGESYGSGPPAPPARPDPPAHRPGRRARGPRTNRR